MGIIFSCSSGSKSSRFKSKAAPVLARLTDQRAKFTADGRACSDAALGFRRDAIRYYDQDNIFDAKLSALKALEHEAMASRYLRIIESIMATMGQINRLGQQYDASENYELTAHELKRLGIIKKDYDKSNEKTGEDGSLLTEKERMELASQAVQEFDTLVSAMNEKIIEIQGSEIDSKSLLQGETNSGSVETLIQKWKFHRNEYVPFVPKPATPANMAMLESSSEEDEEDEDNPRAEVV